MIFRMKRRFFPFLSGVFGLVLVLDPVGATGFAEVWHGPPHSIAIPARYGRITQHHGLVGSHHSENGRTRLVVLQDLHGNPGVQRNVVEILMHLARRRDGRNLTVFVEGALGPVDVTLLRQVPDRWVQERVVEQLLEEAKLTGVEAAAVASDEPLHLWGVDDPNLYIENLAAFQTASLKSPVPHPKHPAWRDYYRAAQERDAPLTLNALSHLDLLANTQTSPRLAVLVAGGFHTQGITQLLRRRSVPYMVVTPVVKQLGYEHRYAAQMRGLGLGTHLQTLQRGRTCKHCRGDALANIAEGTHLQVLQHGSALQHLDSAAKPHPPQLTCR